MMVGGREAGGGQESEGSDWGRMEGEYWETTGIEGHIRDNLET